MSDLSTRVRSAAEAAQPRWTPERAAANELAVHRRGRRRVFGRRALGATVLILAAVAILILRPTHDDAVRYADGSVATPTARGAELAIVEATPTLVRSELRRGGYRFRVTHDAARTFRVLAGAVQVEVLGTEFSVQRLPDEHVRVEVWSGRVRVASDGHTAVMTTGEARVFPSVEPALEPEPPRAAPLATPAPIARSTPPTPIEPVSSAPRRTWVHLAEQGDYDAAYAALQRSEETARSPVELMLAADAARLSHHQDAAVAPLRAVVTRYPHDPRAPLAAFTLGRVLLDDLGRPAEAARAFAEARALAPSGPIAEDALGREVEAWSRGGDMSRARERADEYLGQYPTGTHARAVRRFGGVE